MSQTGLNQTQQFLSNCFEYSNLIGKPIMSAIVDVNEKILHIQMNDHVANHQTNGCFGCIFCNYENLVCVPRERKKLDEMHKKWCADKLVMQTYDALDESTHLPHHDAYHSGFTYDSCVLCLRTLRRALKAKKKAQERDAIKPEEYETIYVPPPQSQPTSPGLPPRRDEIDNTDSSTRGQVMCSSDNESSETSDDSEESTPQTQPSSPSLRPLPPRPFNETGTSFFDMDSHGKECGCAQCLIFRKDYESDTYF
jgi:hypothetical protein